MPDTETQDVAVEENDIEAREAEFPAPDNTPPGQAAGSMDLLLDATMPISVTLGQGTLPISTLMNLGSGSIVQLDQCIGDPVDIYVRDVHFAQGDVVVVENRIGVRIREILSPQTDE